MLESERAPAAAAGEEEGRKEEERGEKEANYQGESFRVEGASLGSIMMKPDSSSPFQAGGGRGAVEFGCTVQGTKARATFPGEGLKESQKGFAK